jgi:ATP-dependent protease ClpP protease subunit|tara:strand:- start:3273 stop:3869 length:597 start_codon:yes stop_codon:yes gene_type:complete
MSESTKPINNKQQQGDAFERPVARIFDLYLSGAIETAERYQDWNQIMRSSGENDVIVMHINSNGGSIFTAIQLMRSMKEAPGTVVASVEGMCFSAATLLFLTADICEISEHSHFMFHTYSSGNWGKGHEQLEAVVADDKWARKLFQDVYKDFLTPAELKEMMSGRDFWLSAPDVTKRLEARNKKNAPKNNKKLLQGKK